VRTDLPSEADRRVHQTLVNRAVAPTPTDARAQAIAELEVLAGKLSRPQERARHEFQRRLHRRDDVEATRRLRLTEASLGRVPRSDERWARHRRARRRRSRR
jgi:hypothetical protein